MDKGTINKTLNHFARFLPFHEYFIKPVLVDWKITFRCNSKCHYCNMAPFPKTNELNTEEALKTLDTLKSWLGLFTLCISGGEPFLRDDLELVINKAVGMGIYVGLITNGTLDYRGFCDRAIKKDRILFHVSLDGLSEKTHEFHRGSGTIDKIISNISLLKRHFAIIIFSSILKHNIEDIIPLIDFARKNSALIYFQALAPNFLEQKYTGWHLSNPLWPTDTKQTEELIKKIITLKQNGAPVINSVSHLNNMIAYFKDPGSSRNPSLCRSRFENIAIMPNGEIKICTYTESIGKINDKNLKTLWQSEKTKQIRRNLADCQKPCYIWRAHFQNTFLEKIEGFYAYRKNRHLKK